MNTVIRSFVLLLALAGFSIPAWAQHRLVTGAASEGFAKKDASPRLIRQRAVNLDLSVLGATMADQKRHLEIAFFDDAVFPAMLTKSERTHSGGQAYTGHLASDAMATVVIVNNSGTVAVMVTTNGRRFSIEGGAKSGYIAREHTNVDRPDHPPSYKNPPSPVSKPKVAPAGTPTFEPPPETAHDDGSSIDVMVVYTPAARTAWGSKAAIETNIDAQIAATNLAYTNSGVVQQLRLVYKGEVAYTEVNMDTDLPRLESTNDGFLDEVPIIRNIYAADFVSFWGVYSDYCGLGSLMGSENASFHPQAYNVVDSSGTFGCTGTGSGTFAHELGHNMGLRHDNFMDGATTQVTPAVGGGLTTIQYAHGYVDTVNRFRTIMSYPDQCSSLSISCNRVLRFSNPTQNYLNNPPYAGAVSAPLGTLTPPNEADERQALNDTRETTANFRASLSTFTGPGVITFAPTTYTVAEGAGNVVVKVSRHLGSTGIVSVQYNTAPATATADVDFTTKVGTLTWAAGDTVDQTITIPILQDALLEGTETFTVNLFGATGGATIHGAGTTATVRIIDDEPDTFPVGNVLPPLYTSVPTGGTVTAGLNWSVDLTQGYLSPASLMSAPVISDDGSFATFANSDMTYTATFSAAGNVSFYYKLSAYQNFSGFEFQIDNVAVFNNANNSAGEVNWTLVSAPITTGTHTLRWRFKNKLPFNCAGAIPAATGGGACADRAWIDSVVMPANGPVSNPPRLGNISTRGQVMLNNDVMIAGFIIGGVTPKTVVVNVAGPSLVPFGIANALMNPTLNLVRSSDQVVLKTNDNWQTQTLPADVALITASGFQPNNTAEPAIIANLAPGAYTAIVSGVGSTTGVGLVGVFEVDHPEIPLTNISTRGQVMLNNDVMIAGFVIQGTGTQKVVINVAGPSLVPFGIANALMNPTLSLVRQSDQVVLATNDNWQTQTIPGDVALITASGFQPNNVAEPAIIMTLPPGAYTAIVSGVGSTTGVGLVGVFAAP